MAKQMEHHDLLSGLVRCHVLHHADQHPIYGLWMIDELANHGYRLSPGTLYPLLAKMERDERTSRKFYTITDKGREGLALVRIRLRELSGRGEQNERYATGAGHRR